MRQSLVAPSQQSSVTYCVFGRKRVRACARLCSLASVHIYILYIYIYIYIDTHTHTHTPAYARACARQACWCFRPAASLCLCFQRVFAKCIISGRCRPDMLACPATAAGQTYSPALQPPPARHARRPCRSGDHTFQPALSPLAARHSSRSSRLWHTALERLEGREGGAL